MEMEIKFDAENVTFHSLHTGKCFLLINCSEYFPYSSFLLMNLVKVIQGVTFHNGICFPDVRIFEMDWER